MLSGAWASESSNTQANCPAVGHKKHCNAMLFYVSPGVGDTRAKCPG